MGWFKKKEGLKKEQLKTIPQELPELPDLPEIEIAETNLGEETLPQLPSIPRNSFGEKFSRHVIKGAISGKEDIEEISEEDEEQTLPKPKIPMTVEESDLEGVIKRVEIPSEFISNRKRAREAEPIFVRIDKFEESVQILEKIKEKLADVEKILRETKEIKEQEEIELEKWQREIQVIKSQVEKVDKDVFSRTE
ncbi:MAG TPA: hypothetical protein VJH65_02235 [Candidatus Nanoarchaeia archaeon]|nr:hypothetical protein [Candidatus Nanoarchaeia archaeon]